MAVVGNLGPRQQLFPASPGGNRPGMRMRSPTGERGGWWLTLYTCQSWEELKHAPAISLQVLNIFFLCGSVYHHIKVEAHNSRLLGAIHKKIARSVGRFTCPQYDAQ